MPHKPAERIDSTTVLNNGVEMPWLGLGTWQTPDGEQVEQSVKAALDLGYRHIDTAAVYANETGVGKAIADHPLDRRDVFLTSKIWVDAIREGYDAVMRAFDASLERLGTDYVDLMLLHWPVEGVKDAWRALEDAHEQGKARAVGVSNFLVHHLEALLADARIVPTVDQYEYHPHLVQPELLRYCQEHQIQAEAWSPIMKGKVNDLPLLVELGRKYDKTPAQITLRWDLQKGIVTIPKSVHAERIAENADLFDFALSDEEVAAIDGLDRGERMGMDPDRITV